MEKTLIGKNGYLFLKNDACKELEVHTNNLCLVDKNFYKRYENVKNKMLFILFPNKSLIYLQFLPDIYDFKYRTGFNLYNEYFGSHLIDGYKILKNVDDAYYKTDTHINNNGALIMYYSFIEKINDVFNLNISKKNYTLTKENVESLSSLQLGIGDLTWTINLGDQLLDSTKDTYYKINESTQLYIKYTISENSDIRLLLKENNLFVDKTNDHIGTILDWNKLSTYILFKKNINLTHKVIIFYDSFLCSTLQLYIELFYEVYCIKSIYNENIINLIKPDYIFEFRVERFLF